MCALYLTGIVIGILVALLYRKTLFRGDAVPFVMELPNYRLPGLKNVMQLLWEKAKDFLQKAFTVIFVATICIWFLQKFDLHFNLVADSKDSILAMISNCLVPIFAPLGLGDLYFIDQRRYGKGERDLNSGNFIWRSSKGCIDTGSGSFTSGI